MAFFATFGLIIVLVIRPQEIWPFLTALRLLDVLTGLSVLGVILEFALRRQKNAYSPQIPFLLAFVFSAYFSTVLYVGRAGIALATTRATLCGVFMLIVMYGVRTPGRLRAIFGLLLGLALFVGAVAIHQGRQEPSCLEVPPNAIDPFEEGVPDGRSCDDRGECFKGGRSDVDYECERLGLFNTVSVERRVRWRGQLGDPNELSVFLGAVIPFALALTVGWKRWIALPAIALSLGVLLYGVILSQSRGGQLVVGVVFTFYFVLRFGLKGLFGAALFALPVLLLGGREGMNADASADERMEVLYDAITGFAHHPVFGMGIDQFTEERHITAHNAYVLTAVDLGVPGFFAWAGLLYASVKIPVAVIRSRSPLIDPSIRALAIALAVSFAGMAIGIFFLSFTYKQLLFVWIGIAGGLYGAVKNVDPEFEVTIGWKDLVAIAGFEVGILTLIFVYTRLKV